MSINNYGTIKQAVVIAETFESDYISASAFNRIGQVSLVDHTFSWLLQNGINQIFLFYSKTKEAMDEHFKKTWSKVNQLRIHTMFMKPEQMKNFGDVMREVQFRNIISQDFLIMYADTFCNFNLYNAVNYHFKAKVNLKNVVLTSIIQKSHRPNKIHVINPNTYEILQTENQKDIFTLNNERIDLKKMNVEFRRDLSHRQIYLCTVDVFKSFKETFQYTSMFDFIHGMLTSEVYEEKIVGYMLDNTELSYRTNYAHQYYEAYLHFISNRFYPYTINKPKCRIQSQQNSKLYSTKLFNQVLSNTTNVSQASKISNKCFIDTDTTINDSVIVQECIIGKNCIINSELQLNNCLVLDGTKVETSQSNCLIETINGTHHITKFSHKITDTNICSDLISVPLFEQTPENDDIENNFQQELGNLINEDPEIQIVTELISVRLNYNKTVEQFTKEIIQMKQPAGVKGVQEFVSLWGQILLKVNETQKVLLRSLLYSCENIPKYNKALHIFLQYFYISELLEDQLLLDWYQAELVNNPDSPLLKKCEAFMTQLKQQADEDSGNDNGSESSSSKGSGSNNSD